MKYLNLVIFILMLLFIGVQYNDPDGPMWMAIYAVPAIWAGLAFFRQSMMQTPLMLRLLMLSILAALLGMVYFWPAEAGWWHSEVWYETETAREGMGMMIVTAVLLMTWGTTRRTNANRQSHI